MDEFFSCDQTSTNNIISSEDLNSDNIQFINQEITNSNLDLNKNELVDENSSLIDKQFDHNRLNINLFSNVRYYIIESTNDNIEKLLDSNGAQKESYLTTFITHVIFDNCSNEDPNLNSVYCDAKDVFDLTIIKSNWVETCLKCNSILPTDPFLSDNENRLFSKLKTVNINLPEDLAKQVSALINFYGGKLINFNNCEEVTHAFSIDYDENTKLIEKKFSNLKILTPDWLVDSIKQNRLIEELIYNPKYLKSRNSCIENELINEPEKIETEPVKPVEIAPPSVTPKSFKLITHNPNRNSFHNNFVNYEEAKSPVVKDNQNQHHQETKNTSPLTPKNIQKPLYTPGFSINVDLNNLNKQTIPNKQEEEKLEVNKPTEQYQAQNSVQIDTFSESMNEIFESVINSKEKMIENENKESTSLVSSSNTNTTNVINNTIPSDNSVNNKFSLNPNTLLPVQLEIIKPINKLNFEYENPDDLNSYNQINNLPQSDFSKEPNSNLLHGCVFYLKSNEVLYSLECIREWVKVIEKFGGRVMNDINLNDKETFSNHITHVLCPNRFSECYKRAVEFKKKVCTVYWLEDVLQEQSLRAPWLAYHFPSPYNLKNGPLRNNIITSHGFDSREKLFIKQIIWLLNGKYTNFFCNLNSFIICKNLKGVKIEKAKKWNVNLVNANWLMELYLGNAYALAKPLEQRYKNIHESNTNFNHFGYDPLLVSDFMQLWKNNLPLEASLPVAKQLCNNKLPQQPIKRPLLDENTNNDNNILNNSKLPKTELTSITWSTPQLKIPCVMFTGIDPNKVAQYQKDVIALGGILSKNPSQTTHLIVDKIDRTAKLIKCFSTCEHIINVKWIIESKLNGKFLDENNYQVKDEKFEKHYNCNLKESLERARLRKPLFSGLIFYLSPSVRPSYSDLEEMVKSAGGTITRDAPSLIQINEPFRDENKTNLKSKYVIIGSQSDLCILKPFIEKKIPIYSEEFVLSGILAQKIDSNLFKFNV